MTNLSELYRQGQSPWLHYLRRAFIESGELKDALESGIRGITSHPAIFARAITCSSDYDQPVRALVAKGAPVKEMYEALVADDTQRAADMLHNVFEGSKGWDGYVTIELKPDVAHDSVGTLAEARHLLHVINRPNVMIEVPATAAGIVAIESLTSDGVNTNATHIFSLETYEQVAWAYRRGIEKYVNTHSVWRQFPASAASVSLSRLDGVVDKALLEAGRPELQGWTGIALAKMVYNTFCLVFSGPEWEKFVNRGARVQRPKWTRTRPWSFNYPDTFYVDTLIGPYTITTLEPSTLNAFRDHGIVASTLTDNLDVAEEHLKALGDLGIDLGATGRQLQAQSLEAFHQSFRRLINSVSKKRAELEDDWRRMTVHLGHVKTQSDQALADLCAERAMCRLWSHDYTLWNTEPAEITNRLGWLHITEVMQENLERLESFSAAVRAEGFTQAVVLGMGGSSLAPELFANIFSPWVRMTAHSRPEIRVCVLDTTDPGAIAALERQLDLDSTLFIVSSKSGRTVETLSAFKYFYNRVATAVGRENAGDHFVAITDPGTDLADIAARFDFRDIFFNDPTIGGRYAALSYVGLAPAALVGLDLARLLERAQAMACNAHSCNCPMKGDNLAAQMGVMLGEMAGSGINKLTLVSSPPIAPFDDWLEQLIAESTGKNNKGIVPVVGEPIGKPEVYGRDRLFVYHRLEGDNTYDKALETLAEAGYPLVTIRLKDVYDLGGLFFMWEMATAVAGHRMGIQPFNQPNVESAKQLARQMVGRYLENGEVPSDIAAPLSAGHLHDFLSQGKAGDYIALQAFVQPDVAVDSTLRGLRTSLRDRYQLATTVGYGPRFLHSTGQLHKGDNGRGLFVQFTADPVEEIVIPDEAGQSEGRLTFAILEMAQALGDAQVLTQARRRLIRFNLDGDVIGGLEKLAAVV